MASDRFEDEYDDDPRPRRRRDAEAAAKSKVLGPAIGLIVTGGLALVMALLVVAQAAGGNLEKQLDDQRDMQLKGVDAGNEPADVKQQKKEMMTKAYDWGKKGALPGAALISFGGLVIAVGGIQMLRLKSRGLAMTASVMAMIPCFSYFCCVLGIPVGIWALVALGNPEVKAAYAGGGSRPAYDEPDELR